MADTTLIDLERDFLSREFVFAPNHLRSLQLDQIGLGKGGKGGKGVALRMTNADFIAAVFSVLLEGAFAGVCRGLGPIQPVRIGGCPLWRTTDLRKALGITEFCDAPQRSGAER